MEESGDRGRGPPRPGNRPWTGEATQKTPLILHSMCIDREAGRPRHESVVGSPLRRGVARGAQSRPMDRGRPPIGCRQEEEMHTIRPVGRAPRSARGSTWPITCHDGRLWRAGMCGATHLQCEGGLQGMQGAAPADPREDREEPEGSGDPSQRMPAESEEASGPGDGGIIEACPHQARHRCIVGRQGSDSRGHIGVHASTTPKERTDGRPSRCSCIVHVAH